MALQYQQSQLQPRFHKLTLNYESQFSVDSGMSSCPSTPSTPTSPIDFDVRIATEDDRELVKQFLGTFFFRDEPLNHCSKLMPDDGPINHDLEAFSLKNLGDGYSFLVLHDGKLVGVCLNKIVEKNVDEDDFEITDKTFKKIVDLLQYVEQQADVFKLFPDATKAMTVNILSVDSSYRGKGIAKELLAKTREIAKQKGCGFIFVDCTSHITARVVQKLGFNLHYSLNYNDYKVDGQVVFEPAPPHKAVTVYTQKL